MTPRSAGAPSTIVSLEAADPKDVFPTGDEDAAVWAGEDDADSELPDFGDEIAAEDAMVDRLQEEADERLLEAVEQFDNAEDALLGAAPAGSSSEEERIALDERLLMDPGYIDSLPSPREPPVAIAPAPPLMEPKAKPQLGRGKPKRW